MSIPLFRPRQDALPPDEGSWHGDVKALELRVLIAPADIREAMALRLNAYIAIGYEIDGETGQYTDRFDELSTTVLLGAFDHGRLVATMRLCFSHPWQSLSSLPCAAYYPALRDVKREQSGSLIEVSRLAVDPQISNTSYRTTLYGFMVRAAFTAAMAGGVSKILVATRPSWVRFYKYILGFEQIGLPALYPPGEAKITLLGGSLEQAKLRQKVSNRFFRITPEEIVSMSRAIGPALTCNGVADERIAV